MRISSLVLLSCCLAINMLVASPGHGQYVQKRIDIEFNNVFLPDIFKEIEKKSGVEIMCEITPRMLNEKVSISARYKSVEEILNSILLSRNIKWSARKNYILIQDASDTSSGAGLKSRVISPRPVLEENPPITVKGKIVNENGEPVIASVIVKGTNKGVTSNANGEFELNNVEDDAVLIISATNIETIAVNINNQTNLSVAVKTASSSLNEVVVNKGYYSEKKMFSTGNVSRVDAKTIEKQPVSNPLLSMQGRMAGVVVTQQSGVPGGAVSLQIRGQNSLRTLANSNVDGNIPLYVVDGVPFTSTPMAYYGSDIIRGGSPLNNINPSDILTIEILKDADATAIYGSRGANGVVLITTKKGRPGKTQVNLNYYAGISKLQKKMDLLDTRQYLDMRYEAFQNDGVDFTSTSVTANDLKVWDTSRYTDWQDVLLGGTAHISNAQMSISGGNDNTQFLFGGGYYKETTIFPADLADNKISAHFNINHTSLSQKFKVNFSGSYSNDNNNLVNGDRTYLALTLAPNAPKIYNEDGTLNWEQGTFDNPMARFLQKFKAVTDNLIANSVISYEVIKGLTAKVNLGYTQIKLNEWMANPSASLNPFTQAPFREAFFSDNSIKTWIAEPQLGYDIKIGDGIMSSLIGGTFQQNTQDNKAQRATGFVSDELLANIKAATDVSVQSGNISKYRYYAFYGRINYNLREKYVVNLTGRRDVSSRFGPGRKAAYFGAVGAGWIFSNEKLFSASSPLSFGKLRVSYGSSGNDQIGDYSYYDLWLPTSYSVEGSGGLYANNLFNPDFGWEVNKKFEAGIELGFLKDRIFIATSYYSNRSSNQLVNYALPYTTGFSSVLLNFPATVKNSGLEIELNTVNIKSKKLEWKSGLNLTFPKNVLSDFPDFANSSYKNQYEVGKPLSIVKAFHVLGVDSQTGVYTFQDLNNNGSGTDFPVDIQALKAIRQQYFGGLSNSVRYGQFAIDIFFQFVKQMGNDYINYFSEPGSLSNQPEIVLNRWQKPGQVSNIQRFTQAGVARFAYSNALRSDLRVTDASFIRLKNISVAYSLARPVAFMESIKFYLQAQNVFTITNYKGLDPETQTSVLPPLRTIVAGVQLNF